MREPEQATNGVGERNAHAEDYARAMRFGRVVLVPRFTLEPLQGFTVCGLGGSK